MINVVPASLNNTPSIEEYVSFALATVTLVTSLPKAPPPIDVTPAGIVNV